MKKKKKDYVSYKRHDKSFEGTGADLEKYYEETYLETVAQWFGDIYSLQIGEQLDNVIGSAIIKRKDKDLYVLYTMTKEAMIEELGVKPLKLINPSQS